MTLPVYKSVSTGSETLVSWPASHAIGDFGLLFTEHGNDSAAMATPSGWTIIPGCPIQSGAQNSTLNCYYRFATSTSESDATIAFAAGGTQNHKWASGIVTYTGVNISTPIHSQTSALWFIAGTAIVMPGLTTLLDDCMIINALAWAADDAGPLFSSQTNSSLGSVTERYDAGTVTGNGGGISMFEGSLATHTTIGRSTLTSSTSTTCAMMVFALCAADKVLPTLGRRSRAVNTGGQ